MPDSFLSKRAKLLARLTENLYVLEQITQRDREWGQVQTCLWELCAMRLLPVGVDVHGGTFWGLDETRLRAQMRMMVGQREQQDRWVQLQEALRENTQRWQGDTLFSLMMSSDDILPIAMAAWVLCGTIIDITQSPNHDPLHTIGPFQHRLWSMELQTDEQAARAEAPLPWSLPVPFFPQCVRRQPDGKDSAVLLLYAVTAPEQASCISLWIRDGVQNDA